MLKPHPCGSGLAREGARSANINAECTAVIASSWLPQASYLTGRENHPPFISHYPSDFAAVRLGVGVGVGVGVRSRVSTFTASSTTALLIAGGSAASDVEEWLIGAVDGGG